MQMLLAGRWHSEVLSRGHDEGLAVACFVLAAALSHA